MSAQDEQLAWEWFEKAEHDPLTSDILLTSASAPPDVVCFHCHQLGEKYLKGFLTWHSRPFAKTHDLGDLVVQCAGIDRRLSSLQQLANALTDYAVDVRYPGLPYSDPTLQEARDARDAAWAIRQAVRLSLGLPA